MGGLTDKIKGTINEVIGDAKQESDDTETKVDGVKQELKGKAQKAKGDLKDEVDKL